jgi:hypothetical protein
MFVKTTYKCFQGKRKKKKLRGGEGENGTDRD